MVWRWILGVLVLLLILLCRMRAGILVTLGETLALDVKAGWFRFRILPKKSSKGKEKKSEKKKASGGESGETKGKKASPKPSLADIQEAVKTLSPPLKKALSRTRRGIRVSPMCLSVVVGGREDPAAAARLYGELNAGIWAGMPAAERLLDIPEPQVHTEVDFDGEKTRIEGTLGVSIRIGTALAVGFGIAVPALRWLLRYLKKHRKKQQPAPETSGARAA